MSRIGGRLKKPLYSRILVTVEISIFYVRIRWAKLIIQGSGNDKKKRGGSQPSVLVHKFNADEL